MHTTEMLVMMSMFTMYIVLGWVLVRWRTQVRRMSHEERMRALELNQPLPPEALRGRWNPYVMPLLLGGAGLGLVCVGFMLNEAEAALGFGFVLMFAGGGWFAAVKLNTENRRKQDEMMEKQQESYLKALEALGKPSRVVPAPPE